MPMLWKPDGAARTITWPAALTARNIARLIERMRPCARMASGTRRTMPSRSGLNGEHSRCRRGVLENGDVAKDSRISDEKGEGSAPMLAMPIWRLAGRPPVPGPVTADSPSTTFERRKASARTLIVAWQGPNAFAALLVEIGHEIDDRSGRIAIGLGEDDVEADGGGA